MKKIAAVLASSVLGLGVCVALVWLTRALGVSVSFPSPGGEDDFSQRAAYFFFAVCPSFLALGAWIGFVAFGHARRWLAMWGGALASAALVWVAAYWLRAPIAQLTNDGAANLAILAFYGVWVALSFLGAAVARHLLAP